MHRLVGQVEEEGFFGGFLLLEPVDGVVGEFSRDVAFLFHAFAIHVEGVVRGRGEILALATEAHPVIPAGLRFVAFAAHVPFPDEAGGIAGFLQILREIDGARGDRPVVVDHPVAERVEAG